MKTDTPPILLKIMVRRTTWIGKLSIPPILQNNGQTGQTVNMDLDPKTELEKLDTDSTDGDFHSDH